MALASLITADEALSQSLADFDLRRQGILLSIRNRRAQSVVASRGIVILTSVAKQHNAAVQQLAISFNPCRANHIPKNLQPLGFNEVLIFPIISPVPAFQ